MKKSIFHEEISVLPEDIFGYARMETSPTMSVQKKNTLKNNARGEKIIVVACDAKYVL